MLNNGGRRADTRVSFLLSLFSGTGVLWLRFQSLGRPVLVVLLAFVRNKCISSSEAADSGYGGCVPSAGG